MSRLGDSASMPRCMQLNAAQNANGPAGLPSARYYISSNIDTQLEAQLLSWDLRLAAVVARRTCMCCCRCSCL